MECTDIFDSAWAFHVQREIRNILFDINGQINISDDTLIFANTIEEHDVILYKVFQRLQDSGLTVLRQM